MENATIFVGEHIMGFKRGRCTGSIGGGTANADGTSESWFYCDHCGQKVNLDESIPACSSYPFPEFTFIDLMRKLGEIDIPVVVRYDTLRKSKNFTIIGPSGRGVCDTDHPLEGLCQYLWKEYSIPEDELGDAILVSSGILERLKARAMEQKPSVDWESELYTI